METMMSHLLASARANLSASRHESPMDLSAHKDPDHQCERFVDQEDLRSESFLSQVSETSETDTSTGVSVRSPSCAPVGTPSGLYPTTVYTSGYSHGFCSSSSSAFRLVSPTQFKEYAPPAAQDRTTCSPVHHVFINNEDTSPDLAKKPLPFSIAALLGPDCDSAPAPIVSAPARVFSPFAAMDGHHVYSGQYHVSSGGILQQPRTNTPCQERAPVDLDPSAHAYWCHVCNEFCAGEGEAARHQRVHMSVNAKCGLRRVIFREHGYVTKHEQTGYLDRIKCGLCNKIVANCFFSKHQQLHNGHVCHVCDHEFSTNSRLKDHMNVHTGSTPFACDLCNRTFAKRSSLTQHQRYHREYKSFQCQFCAKYFNSKYACVVHERLHTGDNPFKCEVPGCQRAFPQKIQLRLHTNSHK